MFPHPGCRPTLHPHQEPTCPTSSQNASHFPLLSNGKGAFLDLTVPYEFLFGSLLVTHSFSPQYTSDTRLIFTTVTGQPRPLRLAAGVTQPGMARDSPLTPSPAGPRTSSPGLCPYIPFLEPFRRQCRGPSPTALPCRGTRVGSLTTVLYLLKCLLVCLLQ